MECFGSQYLFPAVQFSKHRMHCLTWLNNVWGIIITTEATAYLAQLYASHNAKHFIHMISFNLYQKVYHYHYDDYIFIALIFYLFI